MGDDLRTMRERLDALASDGGRFYVACARTGERPFPVGGLRFADRETAADAVELAREYRRTLERYDPRAPHYDLVVHERTDPVPPADAPSLPDACHDVTGAVFEALAAADYRDAQRTILDAYFAAAEATTDPDDLCVVLLRCTARTLDEELAAREQAAVLRDAANRVDFAGDAASIGDALATVAGANLADALAETTDGWRFDPTVRVVDAAVTLPAAVAVLAVRPDADPVFDRAGSGVRARLDGGPAGLATAPLQ
ncbi:hypothetical protein [Halobacterium sp. CBA1126]|uniref:DUF7552 domain-containing protein n=1 Tax=Halobacterium TaxID=2239 RepID=UPI0012FBDF22|nr:hypothetical protein [Halobacterium sp. CBA1126]MUV61434.1 hypothetical protein [Halobacterium sp. CBA1126]